MQQELLAGADDLGGALAGGRDAFAHDENFTGRRLVVRHHHAHAVDAIDPKSQRIVQRPVLADEVAHHVGDLRQQFLALSDKARVGRSAQQHRPLSNLAGALQLDLGLVVSRQVAPLTRVRPLVYRLVMRLRQVQRAVRLPHA